MNFIQLQDNPIVAKIYIILLALASMNYLFLAFNSNPLDNLLRKGGKLKNVIYLLIGIIGFHFLIKSFNILDYGQTVLAQVQDAVQPEKAILEIKTLE
jgi:hypothetical protein